MRLIRALASPSNSLLILSLSKDERLAHNRAIEPRAISAARPSTSSGQAQDKLRTSDVRKASSSRHWRPCRISAGGALEQGVCDNRGGEECRGEEHARSRRRQENVGPNRQGDDR